MKKTLALLVGAAAACASHAQSSVTIYGMVDMSVGVSQTGDGVTLPAGSVRTAPSQRVYRMDSGLGLGSRLGFRGTEDLGGGLRALFLMEMGIAADTGGLNQGGLGWGRQVYVGVGGGNWTLTAGRQYTPMNNSIALSEPVGGGMWGNITAEALGTYESIGAGAASGTFQMSGRANNSLLLSAKAGDLTGNLMVAAGDENSRGTGRMLNLGATYASGPLRADVSYLRMRQNVEQITAAAGPEWLSQWMVGGSYDFSAVKLYAGLFQFDAAKNKANLSAAATLGSATAAPQAYGWDKARLMWLGAAVPFGQSTVKAQLARQTYDYATTPDGRSTIALLAYEYSLSKRTMLYASYGQVDNDERARTPLYGAIPLVGPNGFGSDPRALSVGVQHRF